MVSAIIVTPLAPAEEVFCFPSEGPEYERIINTISVHGERIYQL